MLFKMISEMPVLTVPVNTGYQKYLKFEWFRKYKFKYKLLNENALHENYSKQILKNL